MRLIFQLQTWAPRIALMAALVAAIGLQAWQLIRQNDWQLFVLSCFLVSIGIGFGVRPNPIQAKDASAFYHPPFSAVSSSVFIIILSIGILLPIPWLSGVGASGFLWTTYIHRITLKQRWLFLLALMFFCSPSQKEITSLVGLRPWIQMIQSKLLDSCGVFHSQSVESYVVYGSERVFDSNTFLFLGEWTLLCFSCAMIARTRGGAQIHACMLIASLLPVVFHKLLITLMAALLWRVPLSPMLWSAIVHVIGFAIAMVGIMNIQRLVLLLDNWIQLRANPGSGAQTAFDREPLIASLVLPLISSLGICWCIWYCPSKEQLHRSYGEQFGILVDKEQFSAAAALLPKLVAGSIDNQESIYLVAERHFPTQPSLAIKIIEASHQRGLLDDQCFVWLANQLVSHKSDDTSLKVVADQYYEVARKRAKNDATSKMGLVRYCLATDRVQEALSHIKGMQFDAPRDHLNAARLLNRLGDGQAAIAEAERIEDSLKHSIDSINSVDPLELDKIQLLAEVYLTLRKFDRAIELLELSRTKISAAFLDDLLIATLLLKCSAGQISQSDEVEVLNRALSINPHHDGLLEYCAKRLFHGEVKQNSPLAGCCRQVISGLLSRGLPNPRICLIVGTGLASQGKYDLSNQYLTAAYNHQTEDEFLLNNLAWVRLQVNSDNATSSLELVNRALQINPNSIPSRQTRAEINIALGKIGEAIADLEFVNQIGPPSTDVRSKLSSLYLKSGNLETASAYSKSSQEVTP